MGNDSLDGIWADLEGHKTLGDTANVNRGILRDEDRPHGVCWPCKKLAEEAMTHESPGTAECCKGCDAYTEKEQP